MTRLDRAVTEKNKAFALAVMKYKLDYKFTSIQFSEYLEVSDRIIRGWLNGVTMPSGRTLLKISIATGIDINCNDRAIECNIEEISDVKPNAKLEPETELSVKPASPWVVHNIGFTQNKFAL